AAGPDGRDPRASRGGRRTQAHLQHLRPRRRGRDLLRHPRAPRDRRGALRPEGRRQGGSNRMRAPAWVVAAALAIAALALPAAAQRAPTPAEPVGEIHVEQLPREAKATIALIKKGGPYPYAKDGAIFGNREGLLPKQKRGY